MIEAKPLIPKGLGRLSLVRALTEINPNVIQMESNLNPNGIQSSQLRWATKKKGIKLSNNEIRKLIIYLIDDEPAITSGQIDDTINHYRSLREVKIPGLSIGETCTLLKALTDKGLIKRIKLNGKGWNYYPVLEHLISRLEAISK